MDILSSFDPLIIRCIPDHYARTPFPPDMTFKKSSDFIVNTKSPFFVWIHIFQPHDPYLSSERFKYALLNERIFDKINDFGGYLYRPYTLDQQNIVDKIRLRYNENIMYADDEFGKFVKSLEANGIYENSILIVTGDHGESFRKGRLTHSGHRLENLYQQFIRIPFIIHMPKQQIGKRIESNAEHVDLAPTILDLLNIDVPEWMEGESLKQAIFYDKHTKKPKYSMNLLPSTVNHPVPKGAIAIIKGDYKYILQIDENRGELYNIKNDPYENRNIMSTESNTAEELKQLVNKHLKKL